MCVIRRHFRWVRADRGGNIFSRNTEALPMGPRYQVEESLFFRLKRMQLHACVHGRGASPLSASHVQSSSDDSRLLTTLTTPCRAHPDWNDPEMGKTGQWSRRWRRVGNLTVQVRGSTAAHGRQEQEQRLKKHYGRWMDILHTGARIIHID